MFQNSDSPICFYLLQYCFYEFAEVRILSTSIQYVEHVYTLFQPLSSTMLNYCSLYHNLVFPSCAFSLYGYHNAMIMYTYRIYFTSIISLGCVRIFI
jgi:hypothetical protein